MSATGEKLTCAYCATENTRDADEAYEAIVELSEILVRRGITRFVFDKPVKANPNGYYAKLFSRK